MSKKQDNPQDIDMDLFQEIKEHSRQMQADNGARDELFRQVEDMYMLRWQGRGKKYVGNKKLTVSPDARNAVLGAVRLMIMTDPIFSIDDPDNNMANVADRLEKSAGRIWDQSGRLSGEPIHYSLVLSAVLYSEFHAGITQTNDLVARAKLSLDKDGKQNKAAIARAERIAESTPSVIEPYNPLTGYPEWDKFGLTSYYRITQTTVRDLINDYGDVIPDELKRRGRYSQTNLYAFYDDRYTCIWTDSGPILLNEHGLAAIPVCAQLTEGSRIFAKPEDQRQPLLYTLLKSGLWDRQNAVMTSVFTAVIDMGLTPLYVHTAPPNKPDKKVQFDFDEAPGVVEMEAGEQFAPLQNKGLIDPAVTQAFQLAEQKAEESTLYKQALGGAVAGGGGNFSYANLLAQAGRLPLVGTQKRTGWGIGGIMETVYALLRGDAAKYKGNGIDVKARDIPASLHINVKLDVRLPQDQLQLANIANLLSQGDKPLASQSWVRENILQIGQSSDEQRKIWNEQMSQMLFSLVGQQMVQQQQQKSPTQPGISPDQLTGGAGGAGIPTGAPGPGMPAGPDTGMTAGPMMAPGQGEMIEGGLPPQQAGMMPGAGGNAPEGMPQ